MSAVKHTPGPWSFDGPAHSIIVWGPTPELRVCFMTSDGPAEANARLIAAAPDMLEALSEARTTISILRTQVMVDIGRCADPRESRWEGVPEKLKERLDAIDAARAKAEACDV